MRRPLHHGARSAPHRAWLRPIPPLLALACTAHCSTTAPGTSPAPTTLAPRFLDAALACDPAGNVYAAATELFATYRQIFVAHSSRYGESWSPHYSYVNSSRDGERGRPQLATGSPGEVYVLWEDTRHGRVDLFFNRSLDGGQTWLAADLQVNSGIMPAVRLTAPLLRCDRYGNVFVVWRDDSAGYEAFYCNHSRDRGATWSTPVAVTEVTNAAKSAASLVCDDNGALVLGWSEASGNDVAIHVNASADHGATWQWQSQVLGRPLVGTYLPRPALTMNPAGVVFAAWLEVAPVLPVVTLARSRDRGRTWEPRQQLLSRASRAQLPTPPQLHSDRFGTLYVTWQAVGADAGSVFIVCSSVDGGLTWNETRVRRTGAWDVQATAGFQEPLVAAFRSHADDAGNLYLTWTEGDTSVRGVGFDRVSNHGTVWLEIARSLLSAGHLPLTSEAPLLCADDAGHVSLLWNEGHTLTVATSPFYGDSGWRFEHF